MVKKFLPILLILCLIFSFDQIAGNLPYKIKDNLQRDSLQWSIEFLGKIFNSEGEWYLTDNSYHKPIKGLLNYAENDPVDTVVIEMNKIIDNERLVYLFDRRPQDIKDFTDIKGYLTEETAKKRLNQLERKITDSLSKINIPVPRDIIEAEASRAPVISLDDPNYLLSEKEHDLPLDFKSKLYHSYNQLQNRIGLSSYAMDSLRSEIFNSHRKQFNDSVLTLWRSIAIVNYRNKFIADYTKGKLENEKRRIDSFNLRLLTDYNDRMVEKVNDSLRYALKYLTAHANNDSVMLRLYNMSGDKSEIWTANKDMNPIRMYLKNPQNDSISVILINNGKRSLKLIIDDGVVFTRLKETQNKEITFNTIEPDRKLKKITIEKPAVLPWTLQGFGSVGFTQTALSNWAKGGESSLAMLVISRYKANYSLNKVRWENSAEIRYGINQTKTKGFQKNDDKIEFQSRFGYSAFKKWFYSAESNFRTQMAPGYKFPDRDNPISSFMSPGYLTFSIGLDYKPNKDFSLFLSPLTSKTTYVNDTSAIDPTRYGLKKGTKKLWEPGLIIKTNYRKKIADNITYDTKGEFFNNYSYTFQKFAFDWEQNLTMQVNRFINVMVMTELIYDYNVKFPVLDAEGKEIDRKPKWQFKELFNIGFNYKF